MKKRWKESEVQYIKDNWGRISTAEMSQALDRSESSIINKTNREGITIDPSTIESGRKPWTDKEIDFLKKKWTTLTADEIAKMLGRSKNSVANKASKLGLIEEVNGGKAEKKKWTKWELQYIKNNVRIIDFSEMAKVLGRTEQSIAHKARRMGLNFYKDENFVCQQWKDDEEQFLIENWGHINIQDIMVHLNRNEASVMRKVYQLNLDPRKRKDNAEYYRWTEEEETYLETKWGSVKVKYIARKLKRTEEAIIQKARMLGLGAQADGSIEYLSIKDVCQIIGVSENKVRYWRDMQLLHSRKFETDERYRYQVSIKELCNFLEKHQDLWDTRNAEMDTIKSFFARFLLTEKDRFYIKTKIPKWLEDKIERDKHSARKDRYWTIKEERLVMELYRAKTPYSEIAQKLGRSITSIRTKVSKIKNAV